MGSYDNALVVAAPGWSTKNFISLDKCIAKEVQWLWSQGVQTGGSCCGHGKLAPTICPCDFGSAVVMLALGYRVMPNNAGALVAEWRLT
jgi:hypothetical protein